MITNLTIHQKHYLQMACVTLLAVTTLFAIDNIVSTLGHKLVTEQRQLLDRQRTQLLGGNSSSALSRKATIEGLVAEAGHATRQVLASAESAVIILFGLSSLLIIVLITMASRSTCKPLHTVMAVLQRISSGSGDLATRIPIHGNHEAARVASSYNSFADKLQNVVDNVAHNTAKMEVETRQLSAVIDESTEQIQIQQREIDQIAAAMHEMAMSVQEVSGSAQRAADSAYQADSDATTVRQLMQQNLDVSYRLAETIETSVETMTRLEKDSDDIGMVLDVIGGIAEQTNLLALNAAIEAARAGEQGRGFAVVADEVRTLAQRTQESTHEIQSLIEKLQTGSREVAKSMNESHRQMQASTESVEKVRTAVASISGAITEISDMTAQIAAATEQQSHVAESMSQNLATVNTASERSAEAAQQTAQFGQALVHLAEEQRSVVSQFQSSTVRGFDFDAAREAHLAWKKRVADFLEGKSSLTQSQATSHHDCLLGHWYYGDGRRKYGSLDEFRAIETPHHELHATIREIVRLKQAGKTSEAHELFGRLEPLSQQIVSMLDTLEQNIAALPLPA